MNHSLAKSLWKAADRLLIAVVVLIFVFAFIPIGIAFVMSVNPEATLGVPQGFSLKWFAALWTDDQWRHAYWVSLVTALGAMVLALVSGGLFAYVHSRFRAWWLPPLSALAVSPLGVPGIVIGVGLVISLHALRLNGTYLALILAFSAITIPYVVRTCSAALMVHDRRIEEAALTLGANEFTTFIRITVPMIMPGLVSAAVLAFVFAFGNLQVAIFLVGPHTVTVPALMYSVLQFEADPTIAAGAVVNIILVAVIVLAVNRLTGVNALMRL